MTLIEKITKEAKRIEEDSLYSAKGHFYAAQVWSNCHFALGIPAVVFAAIASKSLSGSNTLSGSIFAITAGAFTAILTFLNPSERANAHKNTGNKYNSLRNDVRIFYEIESKAKLNEEKLSKTIKQFNDRRNKLNFESPQIPKWAFLLARRGIEAGEAEYKGHTKAN